MKPTQSRWRVILGCFTLLQLVPVVHAACPSGFTNGQIYTNAIGKTYRVLCDTDSNPTSYSSGQASSVDACLTLCDNSATCTAASYVGTACYLKNGFMGTASATTGTTSFFLYNVNNYPVPIVGNGNASTGCGNPLPSGIKAGGTVQTLSFTDPHGYVRNYLMRVPSSYDSNKPAPLIVSFHGQGGTGSSHAQESLWHNEVWNPFGIIVYPSAINGTWESNPSYYPVSTTVQPYDRDFVTALLNYMQSTFCIDTGRTFASGQSNGGGFNGVLACDPTLNTVFAAFAPHCGAFYTTTPDTQCSGSVPSTVLTNNLVFNTCNPGRQVPILEIHGDNDGTIGYFGGPRKSYCLPTLPHWVSDWAVRNNLGTSNITTPNAFGNPLVTKYEFGSGSSLGYVTHYRLANWTHNWSLIQNGGPIDSTPLIMDFFYRQTNSQGYSFDYLSSSISSSRTSASIASSVSSSLTLSGSSSMSQSASISSGSATSSPSITSMSSSTKSITATLLTSSTTTFSDVTAPVVGSDGYTTIPYGSNGPSCSTISTNVYAVTDRNGMQWVFMCGGGTKGESTLSIFSASAWPVCMASCDALSNCQAGSYNSGANFGVSDSNGNGGCTLKSSTGLPLTWSNTATLVSNRVAMYKRMYMTAPTNSATTTGTISSTSATASATAACLNQTTIFSNNSVPYCLYCSSDTNGGANGEGAFDVDYYYQGDYLAVAGNCSAGCDSRKSRGCAVWVLTLGSSGKGGTCYYKRLPQYVISAASTQLAGISGYCPGQTASSSTVSLSISSSSISSSSISSSSISSSSTSRVAISTSISGLSSSSISVSSSTTVSGSTASFSAIVSSSSSSLGSSATSIFSSTTSTSSSTSDSIGSSSNTLTTSSSTPSSGAFSGSSTTSSSPLSSTPNSSISSVTSTSVSFSPTGSSSITSVTTPTTSSMSSSGSASVTISTSSLIASSSSFSSIASGTSASSGVTSSRTSVNTLYSTSSSSSSPDSTFGQTTSMLGTSTSATFASSITSTLLFSPSSSSSMLSLPSFSLSLSSTSGPSSSVIVASNSLSALSSLSLSSLSIATLTSLSYSTSSPSWSTLLSGSISSPSTSRSTSTTALSTTNSIVSSSSVSSITSQSFYGSSGSSITMLSSSTTSVSSIVTLSSTSVSSSGVSFSTNSGSSLSTSRSSSSPLSSPSTVSTSAGSVESGSTRTSSSLFTSATESPTTTNSVSTISSNVGYSTSNSASTSGISLTGTSIGSSTTSSSAISLGSSTIVSSSTYMTSSSSSALLIPSSMVSSNSLPISSSTSQSSSLFTMSSSTTSTSASSLLSTVSTWTPSTLTWFSTSVGITMTSSGSSRGTSTSSSTLISSTIPVVYSISTPTTPQPSTLSTWSGSSSPGSSSISTSYMASPSSIVVSSSSSLAFGATPATSSSIPNTPSSSTISSTGYVSSLLPGSISSSGASTRTTSSSTSVLQITASTASNSGTVSSVNSNNAVTTVSSSQPSGTQSTSSTASWSYLTPSPTTSQIISSTSISTWITMSSGTSSSFWETLSSQHWSDSMVPISSSYWYSSSSIDPMPSASSTISVCNNYTTFVENNNRKYCIFCAADTSGEEGPFDVAYLDTEDFSACAPLCDARDSCSVWIWSPYLQGGGACFFKRGTQKTIPGTQSQVVGILGACGASSSSLSVSSDMKISHTASSSNSALLTSMTSSLKSISYDSQNAPSTSSFSSLGQYVSWTSQDSNAGSLSLSTYATTSLISTFAFYTGSLDSIASSTWAGSSAFPDSIPESFVSSTSANWATATYPDLSMSTSSVTSAGDTTRWSTMSLSAASISASISASNSSWSIIDDSITGEWSHTSSNTGSGITASETFNGPVASSTYVLISQYPFLTTSLASSESAFSEVNSDFDVSHHTTSNSKSTVIWLSTLQLTTITDLASSMPIQSNFATITAAPPATTSYTRGAPAPTCPTNGPNNDSTACGQNDDRTCVDPEGKAYYFACDKSVSGGTILNPPVEARTAGTFTSCLALCDYTMGCMAVTYVNSTLECTMYSSVTETGTSAGVQYAVRMPSNDAQVPSSSWSKASDTNSAFTSWIVSASSSSISATGMDWWSSTEGSSMPTRASSSTTRLVSSDISELPLPSTYGGSSISLDSHVSGNTFLSSLGSTSAIASMQSLTPSARRTTTAYVTSQIVITSCSPGVTGCPATETPTTDISTIRTATAEVGSQSTSSLTDSSRSSNSVGWFSSTDVPSSDTVSSATPAPSMVYPITIGSGTPASSKHTSLYTLSIGESASSSTNSMSTLVLSGSLTTSSIAIGGTSIIQTSTIYIYPSYCPRGTTTVFVTSSFSSCPATCATA